jgi:hypothetical protein
MLTGGFLLACHGRDASPSSDASPAPLATHVRDEDTSPGNNVIVGSAGGAAFRTVEAAFVIESPEAAATTVIYLFSKPVSCVDLSFSAWDHALPRETVVLQLKLLGKEPGRFLAVTTPAAPGEAAAQCMRVTAAGAEHVVAAKGGEISLDSVSVGGPARGRVALNFGATQMGGQFTATFCANSYEP